MRQIRIRRSSTLASGRRRWPASLAVFPLVFLLMLGALLVMEQRADRAGETEATLREVEEGFYRLDAASLELWSDVVVRDQTDRSEIDAGMAQVAASLGRLQVSDRDETQQLYGLFQTYEAQLADALAFADAGKFDQSMTSFTNGADVTVTELISQVQGAALGFRARATAAERAKDLGATTTLIIGMAVLAGLSIRSGRHRDRLQTSRSQALVLESSEQRFLSLMAGSADLVTVLDKDGFIRFQSASIESMLGWRVDDVIGRDLREFLHPEDAKALGDLLTEVSGTGERSTTDWRLLTSTGAVIDTEAIITSEFNDPHIDGFLVGIRDQSERLVLEEALRHQAFHDPLTKLANRSLFEDRLAHAFDRTARSGHSVCLLLADLDDFKDVNDSYGHPFGDGVLIEIGNRLGSVVRHEDTVARLGGDEFAILIDEADEGDGLVLAERIMASLNEAISIDGTEVFVHASIGIVTGSAAGTRSGDVHLRSKLLVDADLAMYEAKRQGRGQFRFYAPGMQEEVQQRQMMKSDLERALSRGEFLVHYQPIFSIETEAILGAEALVRWQHPDRGLVPPLEFIATAEQTGLIVELGRQVMLEACTQAAAWPAGKDGLAPYVSVNVAGSQLQQPTFIEEVRATLATTGLPPARLVIEMTESALIEDADDSVRKLEQLHELGVSLAIDDFGTGYSSLSYLRRFKMDILKIDKVFVDELGHDDKRSALVAAMVGMGSSLGMKVIAEGIEEYAQLDDLRALHCDLGQGFLIARPLPLEELTELFARDQPMVRIG